MAEKKGRKSNHVKHDNSIEAVFDILSKVSKSKYSNQSDIKILRNIKLTELANRLSSCLTGLREYGEISNREESLHHQLQCLDKAISKNINLMEWPIKDHWFEGIPFTEVSANELENPRLINIMEDIHNQLSINACLENCLTLSFFNENSQIEMTDEEKRKYNILEYLITGKAWETLGYWTAKLEEMKRGKKNAMVRTTKKVEMKAKVKAWIAEGMKPAAVRLKAQQEFSVTDRTVLNWLKEIKDEKAPVLRKSKGIA